MYPADTIVARATAPGRAAVAIVRLRGSTAFDIAAAILDPRLPGRWSEPWRLVRCAAIDPVDRRVLDDVLAVRMPGPNTYTGEDCVEIHCHGSPVIVDRLSGVALTAGARAAQAGEFTRRAVLNGRMDLLQAEAVADLVATPVLAGVKAACRQLEGAVSERIASLRMRVLDLLADVEAHIDFADEDLGSENSAAQLALATAISEDLDTLTGGFDIARRLRDGYRVVLSGRPNVGKSSLFNGLVGFERAIVADEAGTTRDALEEIVDMQGHGFVLTDTAGIRETSGYSESIAVRRSRVEAASADISVRVIDTSERLTDGDLELLAADVAGEAICVLGKSDLRERLLATDREYIARLPYPAVSASAVAADGLHALQFALITAAARLRGDATVPPGLTRERHRAAAERARDSLERARVLMRSSIQSELVAAELRDALSELATITEPLDNEAVLDRIFAEFCVGK